MKLVLAIIFEKYSFNFFLFLTLTKTYNSTPIAQLKSKLMDYYVTLTSNNNAALFQLKVLVESSKKYLFINN